MGQLEERMLPHVHNVFLWTHLHFEFEYSGNQVWQPVAWSNPCFVSVLNAFLAVSKNAA